MKNKIILFVIPAVLFVLMQNSSVMARTVPDCPQISPGGTVSITIDPQDYLGNFYLNNAVNQTPNRGKCSIKVNIGDNSLIVGGNYVENTINFKVSAKGRIDRKSISNKKAVKAHSNVLKFNNVQITIDPQSVTDDYYLMAHPKQNTKHTFDVVPTLLSYVEFYGTGLNNEVRFIIGEDGTISNVANPTAAFACGNKLTFNYVKVYCDPTTYTGNYRLGSKKNLTGIQEMIAVPNVFLPVSIQNNSTEYVDLVKPYLTHTAPSSVNLSTYQFRFTVSPEITGLTSWWRAENNANDTIGNYGGTLTNTSYDYGLFGKAFKFDNPADPVSFVSVSSQAFPAYRGTLSLWFKWNGNGETDVAAQVLIGSCRQPMCDNRTPLIKISYRKLMWEFGNWGSGMPESQNDIAPDRWYHAALTYYKNENGTYSTALYLNGFKIHEKTDTPADNPINFNDTFGIGKAINAPAHGFNGLIDEITIYNDALKADELLKIYQAGIGIGN